MISNHEQHQQALEQLNRMYQALAVLKAEIFPNNPNMFQLMAEGPIDQIEQLQKDISDFSGISTFKESEADL